MPGATIRNSLVSKPQRQEKADLYTSPRLLSRRNHDRT